MSITLPQLPEAASVAGSDEALANVSGNPRRVSLDTLWDYFKSLRPTNNLDATTDPTVNDDGTAGYEVGSVWINRVSENAFRCVDATTGAAVWVDTTVTASDLGTMATQDADAVSITGGSGAFTSLSTPNDLEVGAPEAGAHRLNVKGPLALIGRLHRSGATSAGAGSLIEYALDNSVGAVTPYAYAGGIIEDATAGSEDGTFGVWTVGGGSIAQRWWVKSDGRLGNFDSPDAPFHVAATGISDIVKFERTDGITGGSHIAMNAGSGDPQLRFDRGGASSGTWTAGVDGAVFTICNASSLDGVSNGMRLNTAGSLTLDGAITKASGSFRIRHPLPAMRDTHDLVHSFVEAPTADNIYRGRAALVDGVATVDLDEAGRMTAGTFELLNGNLQAFASNESGFTPVRATVSGSTLTIEAEDPTCTDMVSWLVTGERKDKHMLETDWTDDAGRIITEPLRAEPEAA